MICILTPNSSNSFTLYLSSVGLTKCEAKAKVFRPSGVFCSSAAPSIEREASHFTRTSNFEFYWQISVFFCYFVFNYVKIFDVCLSPRNLVEFLKVI